MQGLRPSVNVAISGPYEDMEEIDSDKPVETQSQQK